MNQTTSKQQHKFESFEESFVNAYSVICDIFFLFSFKLVFKIKNSGDGFICLINYQ